MVWHCTPREVTLKGFKKCCTYNAVDETMICCGMRGKRMGMLGVSVRKVKALFVKMETVTLSGKGRHALCVKCMKLIVKYFLSRCLNVWELS